MTSQNIALNIDCMEYMKTIPDKFFALAIVDPPYGIGVSNASEIGYRGNNVFEPKDWDDATPTEQYWKELFRVSENQIVFGGNYFDLPQTRCFIVWDKGEGFKDRSYAECEMAWTSFDRNAKIYKRDPLANGDYRGKIHPTQKPVIIYEKILKDFAETGQTILDTHLGSGSSRIACHRAGYDFVGCEIDKDYFDAQEKRFADYLKQIPMEFK